MKNFGRLLVLVITTMACATLGGTAQELNSDNPEPVVTAAQHLDQLKEGVLVVRLPSFRNQLEALGRNADRSNAKKTELLEDREHFARHIMDAFADTFTFCPVLFVFDTAMASITRGDRSGYFLDYSLDIDSSQEIPDHKAIYTLRLGLTDYATTARRTSFIFTDDQGNDLENPFPYSRSIFNLEPFNLKRMFGSSNFYGGMDKRWAEQIVGGIQAKLLKFESQIKNTSE